MSIRERINKRKEAARARNMAEQTAARERILAAHQRREEVRTAQDARRREEQRAHWTEVGETLGQAGPLIYVPNFGGYVLKDSHAETLAKSIRGAGFGPERTVTMSIHAGSGILERRNDGIDDGWDQYVESAELLWKALHADGFRGMMPAIEDLKDVRMEDTGGILADQIAIVSKKLQERGGYQPDSNLHIAVGSALIAHEIGIGSSIGRGFVLSGARESDNKPEWRSL